jgi:hypothetical protein
MEVRRVMGSVIMCAHTVTKIPNIDYAPPSTGFVRRRHLTTRFLIPTLDLIGLVLN